MKKANQYSSKYDALFKKPSISLFPNQRFKIILTVGIVFIAGVWLVSVFFLPKQLEKVASIFNKTFDSYDKQMQELEDSLDYKNVLALREAGLKADYIPDYEKAPAYNIKLEENQININDEYTLTINAKDVAIFSDKSNQVIKATEGLTHKHQVTSVEQLATYQFSLTKYHDEYNQQTRKMTYFTDTAYQTENYISVYVSGNLIDNLNLGVSKEKGSFYEVFQLPRIGQVQTGIIVNASPSHSFLDENNKEIPMTYVSLCRYWLFPDGVGLYVKQSNSCYGKLTKDDDSEASAEENLKVIDQFTQIFDDTQSMLSWLNYAFEFTVNAKG